jgi:hypothetical protein
VPPLYGAGLGAKEGFLARLVGEIVASLVAVFFGLEEGR